MADIPQEYYNPTFYNGNDVLCYPSSNALDNGKLNLEFNMARLVTRLSSKNFCIVNPSFELTPHINEQTDNIDGINVGPGQCSINGMDLIMSNDIFIELPPELNKDYYLAFKLWRDSTNNVKGDDRVGVTITFKGLYLAYTEHKDETDRDVLFLGKVKWDGTQFVTLEEDEDKYGRIWADDILCKLLDPKHPDLRRPTLQNWLYNVPDWYFSKEGDIVYGSLIVADNRENQNPGILINVTEDNSTIIIKDPKQDNGTTLQLYGDLNRDGIIDNTDLQLLISIVNGSRDFDNDLQKVLSDVNGDGIVDEKDVQYIYNYINELSDVSYGKTGQIYFTDNTVNGITYYTDDSLSKLQLKDAEIKTSSGDNWSLEVNNKYDLKLHSQQRLYAQGDLGVQLGSGESGNSPKLLLYNHEAVLDDAYGSSNGLKYSISFNPNNNIMQNTFGKAIWQYYYNSDTDMGTVSLLSANNTALLDVIPNGIFENNLRVGDTLTIGTNASKTTLTQTDWILDETNKQDRKSITITHNDSNLTLKHKTLSKKAVLKGTGSLELRDDVDGTPYIIFGQVNGATTTDVTLTKIANEKALNLNGDLKVVTLTASGEVTGHGITVGSKSSSSSGASGTLAMITFNNGSNDAYLYKQSGVSNLYTSGDFYVGGSGNQKLFAGNTVINGNIGIGGTSYSNSPIKMSGGNISANGTITGTKVYGAVYQDFAETYEKDKDEIIEDGDIVFINSEGKVSKPQTREDCKKVIGICSANPGYLLGSELYTPETRCQVGILGKLYVKTHQEYLTYGDRVKVTVNGAEKVTNLIEDLPFIIGKVIEPYKDGKVRINFTLSV